MDKIKLKHKEGLLKDLCMLEYVANELIRGQNEIIKKLDNHIRNHKEICKERMKRSDCEHDVGDYYDKG